MEESHQSKSSDHEMVESKVNEIRTLGRKRKVKVGASSGKSQLYSEGRRIGRLSKENFPRSRRNHVQMSGHKSFPGISGESLVSLQDWPNLKWEWRLVDEELTH